MFDWFKHGKSIEPRKGAPSPRLDEAEFKRRFLSQFPDPAFAAHASALHGLAAAAWDAYAHSRKSPHTRKAGPLYSDPDYDLSTDWIAAAEAIAAAQAKHDDRLLPNRILLINASPRSEHTCPGEISKSYRLAQLAGDIFTTGKAAVDFLDLSRVTSEYGRTIHPCKACFSTAPALCHWPCSCYPNYALGQVHDWMDEIYPMWVAAHGVLIVTPVHWFSPTSPLKLMMDRLVCADGGNPDPTRTHGKNASEAKRIELEGWDYPRHLAGRQFAVVVHGDTEGIQDVRRAMSDWLTSMHLEPAGRDAELERYIGYWKPYAASHEELDTDEAFRDEVRIVAQTLLNAVEQCRHGAAAERLPPIPEPRQK